MEEENVGLAPTTKRSKPLAVKKITIRRRGALALHIRVILLRRPQGLQINFRTR